VSPFSSVSLPTGAIVALPSFAATATSATASGAWLSPGICTVTHAVVFTPFSSITSYSRRSLPRKATEGVYVSVVSFARCAVPKSGGVMTGFAVSTTGLPLTDRSFASTTTATAVSVNASAASFPASGGTAVVLIVVMPLTLAAELPDTVMLTQARWRPPLPSLISYWKRSVPLKDACGTYLILSASTFVAVPFAGGVMIGDDPARSRTTSPSGS
jgi:hypothetical protein